MALAHPDETKLTYASGDPGHVMLTVRDDVYRLARGDMHGSTSVVVGDGRTGDAFGRLRTSDPYTVFDSKPLFDSQPLLWDDAEVSGAGTTTSHDVDEAMTTIGVALNTAGNRVRQTYQRFNYQPGKSQLVFMTGVLSVTGGGAGITRSAGIYDDENGIFFSDIEGGVNAVIRSKVTGAVVDNAIPQADWNLDTLDGTGPSGKTLAPLTAQILVFDYEWLGTGRVRCGFVIDGRIDYVHQFLHANINTRVYMSTPNLPLRFEIDNDGTGAASSLGAICATVTSEGGQDETGITRYKSTEGTHLNANTANTVYAVIGIRLKTTHFDATIEAVKMTMLNQQTGEYEWLILWNPTVAGTFAYADESNSAIQTAIGATANTVTGGTAFGGGMVSSAKDAGATSDELVSDLHLGSSIAGVADEFVLCVRPLAANADIEASITWRELS